MFYDEHHEDDQLANRENQERKSYFSTRVISTLGSYTIIPTITNTKRRHALIPLALNMKLINKVTDTANLL